MTDTFKPIPIKLAAREQQAMARRIVQTYRRATSDTVEQGRIWFPVAHEHAIRIGRRDVTRGAGIIAALSPQTPWELEPGQAELSANASGNLAQAYYLSQHPLRDHQALDLEDAERVRQETTLAVQRAEKNNGKGGTPIALYEQLEVAQRRQAAVRLQVLGGTPLMMNTTPNVLKAHLIQCGADPASVLPMEIKTGQFFAVIEDPAHQTAVPIDVHAHDVAVGRKLSHKTPRGLRAVARYNHFKACYIAASRVVGEELASITMAVAWMQHRLEVGGTRGA